MTETKEGRIIRISLHDSEFRKYKVYCSIHNISMTQMTNKLIRRFIDETQEKVKIIHVEKP